MWQEYPETLEICAKCELDFGFKKKVKYLLNAKYVQKYALSILPPPSASPVSTPGNSKMQQNNPPI